MAFVDQIILTRREPLSGPGVDVGSDKGLWAVEAPHLVLCVVALEEMRQ